MITSSCFNLMSADNGFQWFVKLCTQSFCFASRNPKACEPREQLFFCLSCLGYTQFGSIHEHGVNEWDCSSWVYIQHRYHPFRLFLRSRKTCIQLLTDSHLICVCVCHWHYYNTHIAHHYSHEKFWCCFVCMHQSQYLITIIKCKS